MVLIHASEKTHQPAPTKSYRSKEELAMRDAMEPWIRSRYPGCRIVHELVVGRGEARADIAAIQTNHFAAFEIKSGYDNTTRLMQQVCMFRLVSPELWVATAESHVEDAQLVQYLIPSLGLINLKIKARGFDELIEGAPQILAEAQPFAPHREAMLRVLWVEELLAEARRHRLTQAPASRPPSHAALVSLMLKLTYDEQLAAVCRQLRRRDAIWRADPPIEA